MDTITLLAHPVAHPVAQPPGIKTPKLYVRIIELRTQKGDGFVTTPQWQYLDQDDKNGDWKPIGNDGLEDISETNVIMKIINWSGKTIFVNIGPREFPHQIECFGVDESRMYTFPTPAKASDPPNSYKLSATFTSGETHDPVFTVKRGG